ncbi:MAG: winged helix-turn-helix domain-containing protein [Acidobacteria bacterium]|nr:winged helix-turn-helix domain-containing protein [Acidobacteriota bacterium]
MMRLAQPALNETLKEVYEFEGFRLDVRRRLLTRGGAVIPLTPKAFETLLVLVRGGGRMLTKGEIISEVWPDVFVEEGNLAQSIFLLRRALGEAKGEHRFIVTMPGAGYYFAPRVRALDVAASCAPVDDRSIASLAVLPFTPLGEEEVNKFFGVGLADALTLRLSRLRGVKVLPTSAALRLAGTTQEARAAAGERSIEALLDGLYQREGGQLRVSVQLSRVSDDMVLWAARFDEQMTDIFAVQDSISEQVVAALAPRLNGGAERRRLTAVRDNEEEYLRRSS